jgi:Fe-S cluster biosynthesis and repair protein YggX
VTRTVQCIKLDKEAPGLTRPTYPGDLGKRIYLNISQEAWDSWVRHQTMLINEYRLATVDPKARKFLEEEMEKFLFSDESKAPDGYVPES